MKRYVNFMSNPDERTAIDQFGTGDKYFGVCTLLATLPGLPMFAHGQIEGFTERYGMEFKQAMLDEWPNEGLVARHQREIAPLLAKRHIFAGSSDFTLYDFWNGYGKVDENVFAYSNRYGDERSLVLYNNKYDSTRGTIHISAAFMDKGSGSLRQRSLSDGLGLPTGESMVMAYRDRNGLEYLRRATDLHWRGLTFDLRGFQCVVLLDWRELRPTSDWPWDRLCDSLNGAGVRSVHEEMVKLRLRPLHDALRAAVSPANVRALAQLANQIAQQSTEQGTVPNSSTRAKKEDKRAKTQLDPRLRAIAEKGQIFFDRLLEQIPEENRTPIVRADATAPSGTQTGVDAQAADAIEPAFAAGLRAMLCGAARLQALAHTYSTDWPAKSRPVLPGNVPATRHERTWAPILAWIVLHSLPSHCIPNGDRAELVALFDRLLLRATLADLFPPWAWRARPVGRPPPRCACCSLRLRLHRTRSTPKLSGQTPTSAGSPASTRPAASPSSTASSSTSCSPGSSFPHSSRSPTPNPPSRNQPNPPASPKIEKSVAAARSRRASRRLQLEEVPGRANTSHRPRAISSPNIAEPKPSANPDIQPRALPASTITKPCPPASSSTPTTSASPAASTAPRRTALGGCYFVCDADGRRPRLRRRHCRRPCPPLARRWLPYRAHRRRARLAARLDSQPDRSRRNQLPPIAGRFCAGTFAGTD